MRINLSLVCASLSMLLVVSWQVHSGRAASPAADSSLPVQSPCPNVAPTQLCGFVDLHTHPMSNLAFGGKLFYGGVDTGSLLPADPDCHHNVRADSEAQALGHDGSTHGSWGFNLLHGVNNGCGDFAREQIIHAIQSAKEGQNNPGSNATGYPDFADWPKWNDITHQKMWVDWIRRAYQGGLRVMVALAHNNKTLGDGTAGPGDYPTDDMSSADLQINEIQSFVRRHSGSSDFMELAYSADDVYRIVSANKLAVVVGIEVDNIGNFVRPVMFGPPPSPPSDASVKAEIDRLYGEGVRYIFPIHLLDNAFGGAAAYDGIFDVSNVRETGHPWALVCANPADPRDAEIIDGAHGGFTLDYGFDFLQTLGQLLKTGWAVTSISGPQCPPGVGQKNSLGLIHPTADVALKEMMRLGMLIDIDHMSQAAADEALVLAKQYGYPMNSGHSGVRVRSNERSLRPDQYAAIAANHGMAGVGSSNLNSAQWLHAYNEVIHAMGGDTTHLPYREGTIVAGFGTDENSLILGMPPRPLPPPDGLNILTNCVNGTRPVAPVNVGGIPFSKDGSKLWDIRCDGVAHYGMLWDFVEDVKTLPGGDAMVENNLMHGADYFYRTWRLAEICGPAVDAPAPTVSAVATTQGPAGSGVTVTITGTNFIGVRSVAIPGVPEDTADLFTVNSPSQITAHFPAKGLSVVGRIVVRTCASGAGWSNPITLVPPTISSISPTTGGFGGQIRVEITAPGISQFTKFSFGGTPTIWGTPSCTSDTTCVVYNPPHTPGVVDVQVCNSLDVCSTPTPASKFTYIGPTVTSVSPSRGPVSGGTLVTIGGSTLIDHVVARILFGGAEARFQSGCAATAAAGSCLTVLSPPARYPGPVRITASVDGNVSTPPPLPHPLTPVTGLGPGMFLYEPNARVSSIVCDPNSACAVELNGFAPAGGAVISLTSSDATAVTLPPTVTVAVGNQGTSFNAAFPPTPVAKTVTLTATYAGSSVSTTMTLAAWPPISLDIPSWLGRVLVPGRNVNPTVTVTGTVTLNTPAPVGGAVVTLSSSDTAALSVPPSVTVAAKSFGGTFTATARSSGAHKFVLLTGSYNGNSAKNLIDVGDIPTPPVPHKCPKGLIWSDGGCEQPR